MGTNDVGHAMICISCYEDKVAIFWKRANCKRFDKKPITMKTSNFVARFTPTPLKIDGFFHRGISS